MELARVLVHWVGSAVKGEAVNVLHFAADSTDPVASAIATAYGNLPAALPGGLKIHVENSGDVIEDTTGVLIRTWSSSVAADVTGSGTAPAAAGVGACVTWNTGAVVSGHRLRGRTFLVPLSGAAYDTDGSLGAGTYSAVQAFATALMAAGPLGIWHRPTTAGGSDGTSSGVTSFSAKDKVALLTSRRD